MTPARERALLSVTSYARLAAHPTRTCGAWRHDDTSRANAAPAEEPADDLLSPDGPHRDGQRPGRVRHLHARAEPGIQQHRRVDLAPVGRQRGAAGREESEGRTAGP